MSSRGRTAFDEEIKYWQRWNKNPANVRDFADWRRKWRAKGPVAFAEEILKVDPNTGQRLKLSDNQKEFLYDIWKGKSRLFIISAGRGAGKTFALAVYIMWRIFTHADYGIACMGGSREQSEKIHSYISGWLKNNNQLQKYCLKCVLSEVKTYANSYASFHACSATSVRGPHVHDLIIDEEAAAEEQGKSRFVKAAIWEVSTSPDIHIIKASTCHWVHGDFLHTWNEAEKLGYKRYRWTIAKHISGEKDPYKTYQDTNIKNWTSAVPWIKDRNIQILRDDTSDDEWLVEALGGISISSGLVFNPLDIESCICRKCFELGREECRPYEEGYCPIVQYQLSLLGLNPKNIPKSVRRAMQHIGERIEGIDWGKVSPCAYTTTGKYKDFIFVLDSLERTGQNDQEKVQTAIDLATKWQCSIIRPDPREWSFNNILSDKGFAVHEIFSFERADLEKNKYLYTLKKYVERHQILIPMAFTDLIRSLKNLSYDERGKVRKRDDHSFDSLLYAVSYYGEVAGGATFWKAVSDAPLSPEKMGEKPIKEKERPKFTLKCDEIKWKIETDEPLTADDKLHIATCIKCMSLWGEKREAEGANIWG